MDLWCHVCGMKFRSMIAEAKHRHNFPALCKRNKMFAAHMAKYEGEKMGANVGALRPNACQTRPTTPDKDLL